jgi:signal transduction histidine kinase
MNRGSLRFRLVAGGIVAILAALSIAGFGLVLLFERHVARTIAEDLDVHLNQILAGIDVDPDGRLLLTRSPGDPRFANPLSGLYWQIGDDKGALLRSRSLWDTVLPLPPDALEPGTIHHHTAEGPAGARVLIAERRINLAAGDRPLALRVAVAIDLARVSAAASAYARDLAIALALLGAVLAIATTVQVGLGLSPLDGLRRRVADIRAGRSRRLPMAVPAEVQPLVAEVNALLDAQQKDIDRSRRRAADLAHGLKTPLAALAADADQLRGRGEPAIARNIEATAEAMSRHVDRELARVRLHGAAHRASGMGTELLPVVRALTETLSRAQADARVTFAAEIAEGVSVPFDRTDLTEVLGNLLDNAARHAKQWVRVTAVPGPGGTCVIVEDDGSGISPDARSAVLQHGVRLDERANGQGLGLAIAQDVLEAYGWRMDLSTSALGGLRVTIGPDTKDRLAA